MSRRIRVGLRGQLHRLPEFRRKRVRKLRFLEPRQYVSSRLRHARIAGIRLDLELHRHRSSKPAAEIAAAIASGNAAPALLANWRRRSGWSRAGLSSSSAGDARRGRCARAHFFPGIVRTGSSLVSSLSRDAMAGAGPGDSSLHGRTTHSAPAWRTSSTPARNAVGVAPYAIPSTRFRKPTMYFPDKIRTASTARNTARSAHRTLGKPETRRRHASQRKHSQLLASARPPAASAEATPLHAFRWADECACGSRARAYSQPEKQRHHGMGKIMAFRWEPHFEYIRTTMKTVSSSGRTNVGTKIPQIARRYDGAS